MDFTATGFLAYLDTGGGTLFLQSLFVMLLSGLFLVRRGAFRLFRSFWTRRTPYVSHRTANGIDTPEIFSKDEREELVP